MSSSTHKFLINNADVNDHFKFILIGDTGVGKSCILHQLQNKKFVSTHYHTTGVDYYLKEYSIDNKIIKIRLWDTSGEDCFTTLRSAFYRDTSVAIIVISSLGLSKTDFITQLDKQNNALDQSETGKYALRVVVYNESDSDSLDAKTQLVKFCKENDLLLYHVSAKTGANIQNLFLALTKICINRFCPITFEEKEEKDPRFELSSYRVLFNTTWLGSIHKPKLLRIFGTHHIGRSDVVCTTLKKLTNDTDRVTFLDNQLDLLEGKTIIYSVFPEIVDKKWTTGTAKNTIQSCDTESGFYDAILKLRNELNPSSPRVKLNSKNKLTANDTDEKQISHSRVGLTPLKL